MTEKWTDAHTEAYLRTQEPSEFIRWVFFLGCLTALGGFVYLVVMVLSVVI